MILLLFRGHIFWSHILLDIMAAHSHIPLNILFKKTVTGKKKYCCRIFFPGIYVCHFSSLNGPTHRPFQNSRTSGLGCRKLFRTVMKKYPVWSKTHVKLSLSFSVSQVIKTKESLKTVIAKDTLKGDMMM